MTGWRAELLSGIALGGAAGDAVRWGEGRCAGEEIVAAVWDFSVRGGSLGVAEATAFCAAAARAVDTRRPLVSWLRSGGTRLTEGAGALAGLARATLALGELADAGVAHISVLDRPTTGGAWVTIGSQADLRAAVSGAVIGFGGPRVVEVVTGRPVPASSHTASSAAAAGLADAELNPAAVEGWLACVLTAVRRRTLEGRPPAPAPMSEGDAAPLPRTAAGTPQLPQRGGWDQVRAAQDSSRPDAEPLLAGLLAGRVGLAAPDPSTPSWLGRVDGEPVVAVALGGRRGSHPGPLGYRQLTRAARLAGRLGLALLTVVDTPGADPSPESEQAGLAAAIGEAFDALLRCPTPTLAVLLGEGGSGGALAGLVCDRVLVGPDAYLAALGPRGAASVLRRSPEQAAEVMQLRPADLLALGIANRPLEPGAVESSLRQLREQPPGPRLAIRRQRWSTPATVATPGPQQGY